MISVRLCHAPDEFQLIEFETELQLRAWCERNPQWSIDPDRVMERHRQQLRDQEIQQLREQVARRGALLREIANTDQGRPWREAIDAELRETR